MTSFVISIAAIALYFAAGSYQALYLAKRLPVRYQRNVVLTTTAVATLLHAASLFGTIVTLQGIVLDIQHISSLIAWFITSIALLVTLRRPIDNLLIFLLPMAALMIWIALVAPHSAPRQLSYGLLSHIILSILAYSLLTIAMLQAVVVALQDRELKHRHTRGILQVLPPIQTMERILFEAIWAGVTLLGLSIITGVLYIDNIFAQHLVHKSVLTIAAFIIFSTLLWGHHQWGWRSQTAARWTVGGFIALLLAYYGSKVALELILDKV